MTTTKTTKEDRKEVIKDILITLGIILLGILLGKGLFMYWDNTSKASHDKAVSEYRQCIMEQADSRGYIIRSECSANWKILDQEADLHYEYSHGNIYLAD